MSVKRPDRTLGPGHDTFWDWCAQGELRLQRCAACGHFTWPVTHACEACGGQDLVWTRMSGDAVLVSWCSFERDYYRGLLPLPWTTILVELAEGPLLISNPAEPDLRDVRIGMPLKLRFTACEDSAGRFNLPVFAPA